MSNSEKFKAAFNVIMEEFQVELKNKEINSIEFVLHQDEQMRSAEKSPGADMFFNGLCYWDPVRRRIVCKRP